MPKTRILGAGSTGANTTPGRFNDIDVLGVNDLVQDQRNEPLFPTYNQSYIEDLESFKNYSLIHTEYYQIYADIDSGRKETGYYRPRTIQHNGVYNDEGVDFHALRHCSKPPILNSEGEYVWSSEADQEKLVEVSGYRFPLNHAGTEWQVGPSFYEIYTFEYNGHDEDKRAEYFLLQFEGTYPDSGDTSITTGEIFYFRISKSIGKYTNIQNGIPKLVKIFYNNHDASGYKTRTIEFWGIGGNNKVYPTSISNDNYSVKESDFGKALTRGKQLFAYIDFTDSNTYKNYEIFFNADYTNDLTEEVNTDTYRKSPHSTLYNAIDPSERNLENRSTVIRKVKTCAVSTQQTWSVLDEGEANTVTFNNIDTSLSTSSTSSTSAENIFLFGDGIPYGTYIVANRSISTDTAYVLNTDFQPYIQVPESYMYKIYPDGMTNGEALTFPTDDVTVRLIPESELHLTNVQNDSSILTDSEFPFGDDDFSVTTHDEDFSFYVGDNSTSSSILSFMHNLTNKIAYNNRTQNNDVYGNFTTGVLGQKTIRKFFTFWESAYNWKGDNYEFENLMMKPLTSYTGLGSSGTIVDDYRPVGFDDQTYNKTRFGNVKITLRNDGGKNNTYTYTQAVPLYYIIGFGNGADNTNYQYEKYVIDSNREAQADSPFWYYINGKLTSSTGAVGRNQPDKWYITDYDLSNIVPPQ